jgi:proteic killer suppression protein
MIQSWRGSEAKAVFEGLISKGFPTDLVKATRRRLAQLDAATEVENLRSPPGNRLHRLSEDRQGQWSISVKDQFRICFVWSEHGPEQVEFVDYH